MVTNHFVAHKHQNAPKACVFETKSSLVSFALNGAATITISNQISTIHKSRSMEFYSMYYTHAHTLVVTSVPVPTQDGPSPFNRHLILNVAAAAVIPLAPPLSAPP